MYVDKIPLEAHDPVEYTRNHPQEAVDKIRELQAERDHLEDLVGEVKEEFAEYKRTFKTDAELQAANEKLTNVRRRSAPPPSGAEANPA